MKRVLASLLVFAAADLSAARRVGFGADVFNQVVPFDRAESVVFSPLAFELDCAVFAEAMDTLPRAAVSEALGSLGGIESTYAPIVATLSDPTNGLPIVMARAFCLPDERLAQPVLREELYRNFGTASCRLYPKEGAEAWLRVTTEGRFDDFQVEIDPARADRYCFYDLVSFRTDWLRPFPSSATKNLAFACANGEKVTCAFVCDTRDCDLWESKDALLLRLPLRGGADFYAMLPSEKLALSELRADFSSVGIDELLTVTKSVTARGVWHGPAEIALPKMSVSSRHDLLPTLTARRIPVSPMRRLGVEAVREIVQQTKFTLDEAEYGVAALAPSAAAEGAAKRAVFDRPFLYFIHHPQTESLLVAGIFFGSAADCRQGKDKNT